MAFGDGIRRNIATVSKEERDLFIDAIKQLNQKFYNPNGSRNDFPAGKVSYWFKQDEIHQSCHVHGCPAFLPWHREMCNRFEGLLRSIHPELSLHYWDWNLDPSNMHDEKGKPVNLFDSNFMGKANGLVGEPLKSAGFYVDHPANEQQYRDERSPVILNRPNLNDPSTWSYPTIMGGQPIRYNPADPPKFLRRNKMAGAPPVGQTMEGIYWATDAELINAPTWEDFNDLMQGAELDNGSTNGAHACAHSYIGGNLSNSHISFRDPFVFLVHANVDRLWAMWQQKDTVVRLNPMNLYNKEGNSKGNGDVEKEEPNEPKWGILSPLVPWSGWNSQTNETGIVKNVWPIRPWFPPDNEKNYKNAKDISVITPPKYDTTHNTK